jgi:hypothetical protein
MKSLKLLASAAAVIALAGCGSHTAVSSPAGHASVAATPSCHQRYETWKSGTAQTRIAALKSSLVKVQAQGDAEDIPGLSASLKKAGAAASRLDAVKPPRCADPKGLYSKLLARVKASGDNARSASGLTGLLLAEAPLKGLPKIERKLNRELDRTVGKNR